MALPSFVTLIIGVAGVFGAFSFFAMLQQDVYKKEYDGDKFTQTLFMMACERSMNSLVAFIGMTVFGGSGFKIPYQEMTISGVTQMISMSASNEALRYVSFTTQVLCKSCKMVPVFIGSLLLDPIKRSQYGIIDYLKVTIFVCVHAANILICFAILGWHCDYGCCHLQYRQESKERWGW